MALVAPAAAALPPEAEDAFLRAEVAVEQEDWALAIKYFEQARRHSHENAEVLVRLALAHDTVGGRDVLAIAWYRAYLAATEGNPDAQELRTRVKKSIIKLETQIEVSCRGLIREARKAAGHYEMPFQTMRVDPVTGKLSSPPASNEGLYQLIGMAEAAIGNMKPAREIYELPNLITRGYLTGEVEFITEALAESGDYEAARRLVPPETGKQGANIFIAMDYIRKGRLEEAANLARLVNALDVVRHSDSLIKLGIAMAKAGEISSSSRLTRLLDSGMGRGGGVPIIYCWIAVSKADEGDINEARRWLKKAEDVQKGYKNGDDESMPKLAMAKAVAQAAVGAREEARNTADKISDPYLQALAHRDIALFEENRKSAEIQDWSALALHYPKTVSYPISEGREVLLNLDEYLEKARGSTARATSVHLSRGAVHLGVGLKQINAKTVFWKNQ